MEIFQEEKWTIKTLYQYFFVRPTRHHQIIPHWSSRRGEDWWEPRSSRSDDSRSTPVCAPRQTWHISLLKKKMVYFLFPRRSQSVLSVTKMNQITQELSRQDVQKHKTTTNSLLTFSRYLETSGPLFCPDCPGLFANNFISSSGLPRQIETK